MTGAALAETRGDATRDRILSVAERLFAERGYGSTGMRDLARAAGIRESTLYHHCGSKDALYREVMRKMQRQIREVVDGALAQGGELPARVRRAVDALFDFFLQHPHVARLSVRAALGDRLDDDRESHRGWVGFMGRVLGADGAETRERLDLPLLLVTLDGIMAYHLLALGSGRAGAAGEGTAEAVERTRAHVVRVVLRILGLPEQAPPGRRRPRRR